MDDQITRREALDKLIDIITPEESTEDQENTQEETFKNEGNSNLETQPQTSQTTF